MFARSSILRHNRPVHTPEALLPLRSCERFSRRLPLYRAAFGALTLGLAFCFLITAALHWLR